MTRFWGPNGPESCPSCRSSWISQQIKDIRYIKDTKLRLWMHCPLHMLWWFFLFLLELLDLAADLFYTAATITGILLARPSLASFYTSLHLLQYFSLLLAFPIHLFYSKNLAKMPIAHLFHLFIHACIFYNSSSNCLKPTHGVHFVITCICKLITSPTIWENVFVRE